MSAEKSEPLSSKDLSLLELARKGNMDALDQLMRCTCQGAFKHVCGKFAMFDLDELHNEVFVKLSKDGGAPLRTVRNPQAFPFFAMQTAVRICLDRLRRERPKVFVGTDEVIGLEDTKQRTVEQEIRLSEMLQAVEHLKDERHRLILYAALQGTEMEEIAASLKITRGHGDVLKKRAVDLLRKQLAARKQVPIG